MKIELTKGLFCEWMDYLKETLDAMVPVSNILRDDYMFPIDNGIEKLIDCTADILGLPEVEHIGNDLSYFIYELDFGRQYKDGAVTVDGVEWPMRNAGEFWDYIIDAYGNVQFGSVSCME